MTPAITVLTPLLPNPADSVVPPPSNTIDAPIPHSDLVENLLINPILPSPSATNASVSSEFLMIIDLIVPNIALLSLPSTCQK